MGFKKMTAAEKADLKAHQAKHGAKRGFGLFMKKRAAGKTGAAKSAKKGGKGK